jgi:hypothetical protein
MGALLEHSMQPSDDIEAHVDRCVCSVVYGVVWVCMCVCVCVCVYGVVCVCVYGVVCVCMCVYVCVCMCSMCVWCGMCVCVYVCGMYGCSSTALDVPFR